MTDYKSLLTVGMATYDDFDGVYFTLQALATYHAPCQYLVIDNAPQGCQRTNHATLAVGGTYLHRPDLVGTSAPRDALFRLAKTPWVLCIDSHVLLEPGAITDLIAFIKKYPDSRDLLQGPLVYDDGKTVVTHWRMTNPPGLWGVWDTAWENTKGRLFTIGAPDKNGQPTLPNLDGGQSDMPAPKARAGETLEDALRRVGCRKVPDLSFDIPMQGLGLFAMRKDAWPGFNPLFRGFGGEEGYLHEKVRQAGGRALCLPTLRWRHRFRHTEAGHPGPSYNPQLEDHVWNLLIGHRELGIQAIPQIDQDFGQRLPSGKFQALTKESQEKQPLHRPIERKRLKLLGVWYTNNAAPEKLLQSSLQSIKRAQGETMYHDVVIGVSAWKPIPNNPFQTNTLYLKPQAEGHAAILSQIHTAMTASGAKNDFDGILFLEHDVLYPPDYFDRMGNALITNPVASNLDYEGMNETGWLRVKERHEPMHQLGMIAHVALENLERCRIECAEKGWCLLEPQGDRTDWARLPFRGLMPSIHVNHPKRFTSHGEVCYEASSQGRLQHPFWGDYRQYWPLEAKPAVAQSCGTCGGQPPQPIVTASSLEEWFEQTKARPSDFHEHMDTMRDLASQSKVCVELSAWGKPALLAMAAGKPDKLLSICHAPKGEWTILDKLLPGFEGIVSESLKSTPVTCDLLFIDTLHQAERLHDELERWAPYCKKWIAVHCTRTYGEVGDHGGPGVLPAIRRYIKDHPEWSVKWHRHENHGLILMTCDPADKKALPSKWKQAVNAAKASWRAGQSVLGNMGEWAGTLKQDERLALCLVCESLNGGACAECGCPVENKSSFPTEECPLGRWTKNA